MTVVRPMAVNSFRFMLVLLRLFRSITGEAVRDTFTARNITAAANSLLRPLLNQCSIGRGCIRNIQELPTQPVYDLVIRIQRDDIPLLLPTPVFVPLLDQSAITG